MKGGLLLKKPKNTNKYAVYKLAITLTFTTIAAINNWPKKEVSIAVAEYFHLIQGLHGNGTSKAASKVMVITGGTSSIFNKFANWIYTGSSVAVGLVIGKFDTPCDTMLSVLAIGVWSVVIYNKLNQVLPEEAKRSLAQPAQYIIYSISPDLYDLEESINNYIIHYVSNNITLPQNSIDASQIINYARTLFYEPILYKKVFEMPIICLLKEWIVSCKDKCILTDKWSNKRRSNKRSSKRSGTSKRSSKRSGTSNRSSSKSKKNSTAKYYTPKEE